MAHFSDLFLIIYQATWRLILSSDHEQRGFSINIVSIFHFLFEPLIIPNLVHLTALGTGLPETCTNCKTPCAKYPTLSPRVININEGLLFILKCTLTGIIKFVLLVMTPILIKQN
jgi:hypothetical protein